MILFETFFIQASVCAASSFKKLGSVQTPMSFFNESNQTKYCTERKLLSYRIYSYLRNFGFSILGAAVPFDVFLPEAQKLWLAREESAGPVVQVGAVSVNWLPFDFVQPSIDKGKIKQLNNLIDQVQGYHFTCRASFLEKSGSFSLSKNGNSSISVISWQNFNIELYTWWVYVWWI